MIVERCSLRFKTTADIFFINLHFCSLMHPPVMPSRAPTADTYFDISRPKSFLSNCAAGKWRPLRRTRRCSAIDPRCLNIPRRHCWRHESEGPGCKRKGHPILSRRPNPQISTSRSVNAWTHDSRWTLAARAVIGRRGIHETRRRERVALLARSHVLSCRLSRRSVTPSASIDVASSSPSTFNRRFSWPRLPPALVANPLERAPDLPPCAADTQQGQGGGCRPKRCDAHNWHETCGDRGPSALDANDSSGITKS